MDKVKDFLAHFNSYHSSCLYVCGIDSCNVKKDSFASFKHHLYRVYQISQFRASNLVSLINSSSFFHQFIKQINQSTSGNFSFSPCLPHFPSSISSQASVDDFSFIKKVGKLAFFQKLIN